MTFDGDLGQIEIAVRERSATVVSLAGTGAFCDKFDSDLHWGDPANANPQISDRAARRARLGNQSPRSKRLV